MKRLYMETPSTGLLLTENEDGLCGVEFCREAVPDTEETELLCRARQQLNEYFAGRRQVFTLPLSLHGTVFQKQVWRELLKIPYGETCSYGEIARRINRPRAARAVGMAVHSNPLAIIVPCHRIIGADGSLTGFGGGLPLKAELLALEHFQMEAANERGAGKRN